MLDVSNLRAGYGGAWILNGISLSVGKGEIMALLGRNGAGKSTVMKSVMGLVRQKTGQVLFEGADITARPSYAICRAGLGYVPEDRRVFSDLTVEENLQVGRRKKRPDDPEWTPDRLYSLFPNLKERRRNLGKQLSGGEQQMLTIARSLMGNPKLVLLDEPSEGIAPIIIEQMALAIKEMQRQGISVLLSEQNLHFARLVSGRTCIIEKGKIRYSGTFDQLDQNGEISRKYLAV